MPPGSGLSPTRDPALEVLKNRVYRSGLPLVMLAALIGALVERPTPELGPLDRYNLPFTTAWLFACYAVLLWQRRITPAFEYAVLGGSTLFFVLNTHLNLSALALWGDPIGLPALWTGALYLWTYMVGGYRHALQLSVAILGLQLLTGLLTLLPLWWEGWRPGLSQLNTLAQFYLSQVAYLLLSRLVIGFGEQVTRLRLQAETYYRLAHTDALTGVPNRRYLLSEIGRELERGQRYKRSLALILLDLDRFKHVNDRYGHETGDRVLQQVAQRIQRSIRQSDRMGRWGGEEFLVLLPELGLEEATQLAERLREELKQPLLEGLEPLSASLGVVVARPGDTPDYLVNRADQAMYAAKRAGGNLVEAMAEPRAPKGDTRFG